MTETTPARLQVSAALDDPTYGLVATMAEKLGRTRAQIATDLIVQGIRALQAAGADEKPDADPEAAAIASALQATAGPDPAILVLVDAINARLDRLAETSVEAAKRQAIEVGTGFLRWAEEDV